jgi:hypothetical protein
VSAHQAAAAFAAVQAIRAGDWDRYLRELDAVVRQRRRTAEYLNAWRTGQLDDDKGSDDAQA